MLKSLKLAVWCRPRREIIGDMQVAGFDEVLNRLAPLDPWLTSLGVPIKSDRWHEAVKAVKLAKDRRTVIDGGGQFRAMDEYAHASSLFDAIEIIQILEAFYADATQSLREKVMRASRGCFVPAEEKIENSSARNAMFELALASRWKSLGLQVELGEPDIQLHIGNTRFLVECKRPFEMRSVPSNIEDANSQLGRELDKPENAEAFGMIAISLSRAFTRGDLTCFAPEQEGRPFVEATLAETIANNKDAWRLQQPDFFHERVVAVMFDLVVPWDMNGTRLVHVAMGNFWQVGPDSRGWQVLSNCRALAKM
jgi:hypothetical protein